MIIITFAGKLLGLFRDSIIGSHYGTDSVEGAAYNIASQLPRNFMDIMFAAVVTANFIPVFNLVMQKRGRDAAYETSYRFISLIVYLSAAVTVILMLLARPIVSAYSGGTPDGIVPLGTTLLRVMLPLIILSCAAFSLTGILQSMGEFNIPAAMALVSNVPILVYLIFFLNKFGTIGLCAVFLLGWALQLAIQLPFLKKNGFKFRFKFPSLSQIRKDEDLRQIALLAVPVMVGTWVAPVNFFVNGLAATHSGAGSQAYNALAYANTLYSVLTGVVILSISNLIFPKLSAMAANDDSSAFDLTMRQTIRVILYLMIPMALGLIAVGQPLIRLYYERGNFDAASTSLTSSALVCFAAGMPGFGLQTVLARGFYARREGKTPLYTGIAAMAANLGLSFLLMRFMRGAEGPALASSVAITIVAGLMLWRMGRRSKAVLEKKLLFDALKMLAAGAVMFALSWLVREGVQARMGGGLAGKALTVVLPVLVGVAVYLPLTLALRVDEAKIAVGMVRRKRK